VVAAAAFALLGGAALHAHAHEFLYPAAPPCVFSLTIMRMAMTGVVADTASGSVDLLLASFVGVPTN
jgi:hypothetical protein